MIRCRTAGFTFVELLVSITVIGLLSSIAVPKYRTMKRQALAAQVLGDFDVIRVAALSFYADSGHFPPESGAGATPTNLDAYLPIGFSFQRSEWTLDYQYYAPGGGSAELVGVSAATLDEDLGTAAMVMLGNNATIMINGKLTFFISGT